MLFHPDTNGRTSIKVTLPAVMKSSAFLKDFYGKPIYGASKGIPSKNFPFSGTKGMIWWVPDGDGAKNPYDLLPPIFSDMSQDELEAEADEEGEGIREGGASQQQPMPVCSLRMSNLKLARQPVKRCCATVNLIRWPW